MSFIISFFSGFVTSMVGTLIPGNLNATAMEITMSRGKTAGILFGAGSAIIEIIYIRLTLMGIGFFIRQKNLFDILQWVVVGFFFLAGVYVFIRSFHKKKEKRAGTRRKAANLAQAFFLGVLLKGINPAQFGFWISWSTYLISQDLLKPDPHHYTIFCLGLGSATFVGYTLYVFFGEYIQSRSFFNKKVFDRVVGLFLCAAALLWVARMIWFN